MSKVNAERGGCVDVFHASLLKNAHYAGEYDFPIIKEEHEVPGKMITFSRAMREKEDYHQWVCFYEDDYLFERIWNQPLRYVEMLRRFEGVITPDFSVYYDMPHSMQLWNIFRSRTIGTWLQQQGIRVIPNIRFGDRWSFDFCCDGIPEHSVISIGSLGCLRTKEYRSTFEEGIKYVADRLKPSTIVFYGAAPSVILEIEKRGIDVVIIKPRSFHEKEEVK